MNSHKRQWNYFQSSSNSIDDAHARFDNIPSIDVSVFVFALCLLLRDPASNFPSFSSFCSNNNKKALLPCWCGGKMKGNFFSSFLSCGYVLLCCVVDVLTTIWNLLSLTENNKTFFELLFSYCCSFIALFCYFFLGMSQGFGVIILGCFLNICELFKKYLTWKIWLFFMLLLIR